MPIQPVLPLLFLSLIPLTSAYSWTAGNITADPPFQISPSTLSSSIHKPKAVIAAHIPGYDTSLPPSAITPSTNSSTHLGGWFLNILLAPDVPLSDSTSGSVDKSKFTELTALGLQTGPNATWDEKGWRVCATVFVGGVNGGGSKGNNNNGFNPSPSCSNLLPDECVQALHNAAGSNGLDDQGNCRDIGVPPGCDAIGSAGAQVTTQINSTILPSGNFFAYGTSPTDKGDNVSITAAADMVWPVIINWAHLAENGKVQSSDAVVACMSNTGYRYDSAGVSDRRRGSGLGMWLALGLAVLGTGFMA